jgi:hypothetical protein
MGKRYILPSGVCSHLLGYSVLEVGVVRNNTVFLLLQCVYLLRRVIMFHLNITGNSKYNNFS